MQKIMNRQFCANFNSQNRSHTIAPEKIGRDKRLEKVRRYNSVLGFLKTAKDALANRLRSDCKQRVQRIQN